MSTKKGKKKTTVGEKRRLNAVLDTADECADWLKLAVKKRRVTATALYRLASDFLPEREVPIFPILKKNKTTDDEQLDKITDLLSSRVNDWGNKTKVQWCADVQQLKENDPVALQTRIMTNQCNFQFNQMKTVYDVLTDLTLPPLKLPYRRRTLQLQLTTSAKDALHLLFIQFENKDVNPFTLNALKKTMNIQVMELVNEQPLWIELVVSGSRIGSVQWTQSLGTAPITIKPEEILDAAWIRSLVADPTIFKYNLNLIASHLFNIKPLAIIVSQFLAPTNLYIHR